MQIQLKPPGTCPITGSWLDINNILLLLYPLMKLKGYD